MVFCHIIDDYKLQAGVLNNLKQRRWWEENSPDPLYKYDYIVGLAMHSMSWAFMIQLPIAIYYNFNISGGFIASWFGNACLHGAVDDLKANRHKLNLVQDQAIHMLQIIFTFIILL